MGTTAAPITTAKKALWQPFLPEPLTAIASTPINHTVESIIPPQSEIPLPPKDWLTNYQSKKSPVDIPLEYIVRNIPQDRINFSPNYGRKTNFHDDEKVSKKVVKKSADEDQINELIKEIRTDTTK